jgi:transcriptional regulator with XRE-family HTH domain
MDIKDALSANLRSQRARINIGQDELATRMTALGWKWVRQTVSKVEHGQRRVTAEEIFGLAQALDTTATSLMQISANGPVFFPNGQEVIAARSAVT